MTTRNAVPDVGPSARHAEAGSAYLATLLVLVVLTILGLSLAVITQTEVLIGGSEKQATRQLFSANAGVEMAMVYAFVSRNPTSHQLKLAERTENLFGQATVIGDEICTSDYSTISSNVCDLCALNQDSEYAAMQSGVTVVALRAGGSALASRKTLGAVITLEPVPKSLAGVQKVDEQKKKSKDGLGGPSSDTDPGTEVDPCEDIFLKI